MVASFFDSKSSFHEYQALQIREKGQSKENLPLVEEDQVREYLSKLDIRKSMGPDRVHTQLQRELADVSSGGVGWMSGW